MRLCCLNKLIDHLISYHTKAKGLCLGEGKSMVASNRLNFLFSTTPKSKQGRLQVP